MTIELHLSRVGLRERIVFVLARALGATLVLNYGPPSIIAGGVPTLD